MKVTENSGLDRYDLSNSFWQTAKKAPKSTLK